MKIFSNQGSGDVAVLNKDDPIVMELEKTVTAKKILFSLKAITSTDAGFFGIERRQVPEHPLQAHVLWLARRLHLAGVVIVQDAVRQPRDRHRRVPALARCR